MHALASENFVFLIINERVVGVALWLLQLRKQTTRESNFIDFATSRGEKEQGKTKREGDKGKERRSDRYQGEDWQSFRRSLHDIFCVAS